MSTTTAAHQRKKFSQRRAAPWAGAPVARYPASAAMKSRQFFDGARDKRIEKPTPGL